MLIKWLCNAAGINPDGIALIGGCREENEEVGGFIDETLEAKRVGGVIDETLEAKRGASVFE